MINGLDLFSGIGGLTDALAPWVQPVAYCESDPGAQSELLSRMGFGTLPIAPIWDDVSTLSAKFLPSIDMVYGGFPCQDLSTAGDGAGLEGKRSGLVFELFRIVSECRPRFIYMENVPALTVRGLDRLLLELDALGYDARWTIVSAAEVGAKHLRERIWIVAHAHGESVWLSESRLGREAVHDSAALENGKASNAYGAGTSIIGQQSGLETKQPFSLDLLEGNNWDEYAAFLLRVDHGLPHRCHRIRSLGNAVVPQAAREAFMRLMGLGCVA